jgi:hypothetical protein
MKTLHSTSAVTDNLQEPKVEAPQSKDTYRAPLLVTLGTAADLVQGTAYGNSREITYAWVRTR